MPKIVEVANKVNKAFLKNHSYMIKNINFKNMMFELENKTYSIDGNGYIFEHIDMYSYETNSRTRELEKIIKNVEL